MTRYISKEQHEKERAELRALDVVIVGLAAVALLSSRKSSTPRSSSAPSSAPGVRFIPKTEGATVKSGAFTLLVLPDFSRTPLKVGDFAKVVFVAPTGRQEGLWLKITSIKGELFTGTVDNDPVVIPGLKLGQSVRFSRGSIKETQIQEG